MITNNEYYRKWYDSIAPTQPAALITELKIQGLWYPPDVCHTVRHNLCGTIDRMVDISHKTGHETGSEICRSINDDNITTTEIVEGTEYGVVIPKNACPKGYESLGSLHTHPPYQELSGIPNHFPSPTDLQAEIFAGSQSSCIVAQPSGLGQCFTLRAGKAIADAYSVGQEMSLDLEYKGRISPETKSNVETFIKQFGCEFGCKKRG